MARNDDDDREREPGDDDRPGYRVDYDPEYYDEYEDIDYGFDLDLGEEEVY